MSELAGSSYPSSLTPSNREAEYRILDPDGNPIYLYPNMAGRAEKHLTAARLQPLHE